MLWMYKVKLAANRFNVILANYEIFLNIYFMNECRLTFNCENKHEIKVPSIFLYSCVTNYIDLEKPMYCIHKTLFHEIHVTYFN